MATLTKTTEETKKAKIRAYLESHSGVSAGTVATKFFTTPEYVREIASEHGLKLGTGAASAYSFALQPIVGTAPITSRRYPTQPVSDYSDEHRIALASRRSTNPEILKLLAYDKKLAVREQVAANLNTPPVTLAHLADDPSLSVRVAVAANPNTLPGTLARLADDDSYRVERCVAANPNSPPEALARLAEKAITSNYVHHEAIAVVAENRATPPGAQLLIAKEGHKELWEKLLSNPCVTPEALGVLLTNRMFLLSEKILGKLGAHHLTPSHALNHLVLHGPIRIYPFKVAYSALSANTSAPSDALKTLETRTRTNKLFTSTREKIAANPNTPPETLIIMASDTRHEVRRAVASNPNTPPGALRMLTTDSRHEVRRAVAANPYTPQDALTVMVSDEHDQIRGAVAGNPSSLSGDLNTLASDRVYWIRLKVAQNPSTPKETLIALTSDRDHDVRREARLALLAFGVHPAVLFV